MSLLAERWARAQKTGNSSAKQVLIELAHCLNGKTGECYPGRDYLEQVTELQPKTISRATGLLVSLGLVRKEYVKGNSIRYTFPTFNPTEWASERRGEIDLSRKGEIDLSRKGETAPTQNAPEETDRAKTPQQIGRNRPDSEGEIAPADRAKSPHKHEKNKERTGKEQIDVAPPEIAPDAHAPDMPPEFSDPYFTDQLFAEAEIEAAQSAAVIVETPKTKPRKKRVKAEGEDSDRRTPLTLTELPDEWRAYCEKTAPRLDPDRVWAEFEEYRKNRAKGDQRYARDWFMTWRNEVQKYSRAEEWLLKKVLRDGVSPKRPARLSDRTDLPANFDQLPEWQQVMIENGC